MTEYKSFHDPKGGVSRELLRYRLSMPLDIKLAASRQRIKQFHTKLKGKTYIAFSGGKDSTVLLHLVRSIYPDTPAVFSNTGMEYPEIVDFVKKCQKTMDNIEIIRPRKSFKQVVDQYGYPAISKEQALFIRQYRTTKSDKLKNLRIEGNKSGCGKISKKYYKFLDPNAPRISDQCCDWLKKDPFKQYEKETKRHAYIGTMVGESKLREEMYRIHGCNQFDTKRMISKPMSVFTEANIYEYIDMHNIDICPIYKEPEIDRTGCMFCAFGVTKADRLGRFQHLKAKYPKQFNYVWHKLGLKEVMEYMGFDEHMISCRQPMLFDK